MPNPNNEQPNYTDTFKSSGVITSKDVYELFGYFEGSDAIGRIGCYGTFYSKENLYQKVKELALIPGYRAFACRWVQQSGNVEYRNLGIKVDGLE